MKRAVVALLNEVRAVIAILLARIRIIVFAHGAGVVMNVAVGVASGISPTQLAFSSKALIYVDACRVIGAERGAFFLTLVAVLLFAYMIKAVVGVPMAVLVAGIDVAAHYEVATEGLEGSISAYLVEDVMFASIDARRLLPILEIGGARGSFCSL